MPEKVPEKEVTPPKEPPPPKAETVKPKEEVFLTRPLTWIEQRREELRARISPLSQSRYIVYLHSQIDNIGRNPLTQMTKSFAFSQAERGRGFVSRHLPFSVAVVCFALGTVYGATGGYAATRDLTGAAIHGGGNLLSQGLYNFRERIGTDLENLGREIKPSSD